jgi:serine/threonine protein kinase
MTRSARRPQRKSIGPYEIVAELAATSALGTLWLGSARSGPRQGEPLLFRRVAAEPGLALERLAAAALRASAVTHDSILSLDAWERDDDELVIISDYVEGDVASSLLRLTGLARRPLPVPVALRIAADVAEALAHLHAEMSFLAAPSPDSLWIGTDGRTRLLEPGLHAFAAEQPPWRDNPRRASYDAPERFGGAADARSDLFSLAVVLWEMLRNRRLFASGTIEGLRERIQAGDRRRVDTPPLGERIDAGVADLVERALARDPADRFPSAAAFSEALGRFPLAEPWDVAAFLDELCRDELERQRRLVDDVVHAEASEPPAVSSRRPGALLSTRPPATAESFPPGSVESPSPARSFDEALIVSPDSFSPSSSPREALDSFETLVAAEGIAHEPDDDDFDALRLDLPQAAASEPPESERRLRARALEALDGDDDAAEPPPESGRRRASSASPESGRRRASGAHLPAAVPARPVRSLPRGLAPLVFGAVVALVGLVVGFLLLRDSEPATTVGGEESSDSVESAPSANEAAIPTPSSEVPTTSPETKPEDETEPTAAPGEPPRPPPTTGSPAVRPSTGAQPKYTPGDI